MIKTYDLWINGEHTKPASGKYFDVLNPLDDSLYCKAAESNQTDINKAVDAAHACFSSYRKCLAKDREAMLTKAADLLERDREEFLEILIDEVGSPINKAQFEVTQTIGQLRAAAGSARRITGQTMPSDTPGRLSMSVRKPLGVVAAITPFNVPLLKAAKLVASPLATGNTVVLLTSEEAPAVSFRFAKLIEEAGFPAGSLNVVSGFGVDVGDFLTDHPLVKAVMFTGSSVVGKHISEICGRNMKPCVLELGGKSPYIVLADADLGLAVQNAIIGMFFYQGQACIASSRIIVEAAVYEQFVEMYSAAAKQLSMGDLHEMSTILGPIISPRQRNRVRTHIEDAVSKGATLVTGGEWEGNRCQPTILTNVTEDMIVCRQETFGPVTSIYSVENAEEALALANDTHYGLSGAIHTNDLNKALSLAHEVETGMIHINAPSVYDEPHVPFGGIGDSGFGREGVDVDIDALTQWKWITIQMPGYDQAH
ncbi:MULTISPECIES: aldehyde dehydrogenase family protein [Cycloclasticus]|uniref:aldehyde dehydrogenase family protein n=1 Tax=Cycloclasticus TaxID=34067 RepID=UPI00037061BF|nr:MULTISPECIES: aldehyde dehydrogenase family protein [Cycloclasticus]PHR51739.1 MAG: aldehyde dehydrogenase [Cycloclasticus sp.]